MARVTDFRLDRYEIPMGRYYDLPATARRLIECYGREILPPPKDGFITVEIAAYRWHEIQAQLNVLVAGTTAEEK